MNTGFHSLIISVVAEQTYLIDVVLASLFLDPATDLAETVAARLPRPFHF